MQFYNRVTGIPARLTILPGAFNPPTRAHLAMAESALKVADEVLFVLPRAFPHKEYSGAGFDTRVELLRAALAGNPRFSLASSDRIIQVVGVDKQSDSLLPTETQEFVRLSGIEGYVGPDRRRQKRFAIIILRNTRGPQSMLSSSLARRSRFPRASIRSNSVLAIAAFA